MSKTIQATGDEQRRWSYALVRSESVLRILPRIGVLGPLSLQL